MPAASITFDSLDFDHGTADPAHARAEATFALPRDADFAALVEEIRQIEGEPVADPPLLFKLVMAGGSVLTLAGGIGLVTAAFKLTARLVG